MSIQKIAVTGTKGKTTVVNMIAHILRELGHAHVLHVNTTGHFLNGVQKSTFQDSKRVWGLVPSVAPGRYLYEFFDLKPEEEAYAVLETSLGSSTLSGIGYGMHGIGILLNIYEDHIGSSPRISSQEDILTAKRFIFQRLLKDGWAILNADDPLVLKSLRLVEKRVGAQTVFFGLNLTSDTLPEGYAKSRFVTIQEGIVVYGDNGRTEEIVPVVDIQWTFQGHYTPSVYNVLAIVSGIIASSNGVIPAELGSLLRVTKMDPYGGRLTLLESERGVKIIADYAHEKKSLVEIGQLARSFMAEGGKVIGVVRLAYDRTDSLIQDTGRAIAEAYDAFIVYDKIDGYYKKPNTKLQFSQFTQEVGKVSGLLSAAIREKNPHVETILREDHAILRASELAEPGDVVVVIVNDDVVRSIRFIQDAFQANFA